MAHQLCKCSAKLLYLSAFHFPLLPLPPPPSLSPCLPSFYLNAACALLTLSSLFFSSAPSEYVFTSLVLFSSGSTLTGFQTDVFTLSDESAAVTSRTEITVLLPQGGTC